MLIITDPNTLQRFVHRLLAGTIAAIALSGCYDRHSQAADGAVLPAATTSVAELRKVCDEPMTITRDVVLRCRVTTDDRPGNFYRTLFAEDGTGGVEIFVGTYNSSAKYPAGADIALRLNGCAVALTDGVLQIGLEAESYSSTAVDYFLSDVLLDRHIVRGADRVPVEPADVTVGELTETMCGRLVRIPGVRYSPADEADDGRCEGFRRFTDTAGNEIYTSVSEYADFADAAIPDGTAALRGILLHGHVTNVGRGFIVKPIDADGYETAVGIDD